MAAAARFTVTNGAYALQFAKSIAERLKVPAFQISLGGVRPLLELLGESGKGMTVCQVVPNPEQMALPIVRDYRNALKRVRGAEPDYASIEGYIGARVLIEALGRAGPGATRERFASAFASMRPFDLGGYEVSYAPGNHNGSTFTELSFFNGKRFVR